MQESMQLIPPVKVFAMHDIRLDGWMDTWTYHYTDPHLSTMDQNPNYYTKHFLPVYNFKYTYNALVIWNKLLFMC